MSVSLPPVYFPSASSGVFGKYLANSFDSDTKEDPAVTTSGTTTTSLSNQNNNNSNPSYPTTKYLPSADSGVFGYYGPKTTILAYDTEYRASNATGVFGSYSVLTETPLETGVPVAPHLETADDWKSPGAPNGVRIIGEWRIGQTKFFVCHGSVVDFSGEALVNAANEGCLGGGGVDGAITRAGGYKLNELRRMLPLVSGRHLGAKRCETGSAVMTGSGFGVGDCKLRSKYVMHAVGPNYLVRARGPGSMEKCDDLLRNSYLKCMELGRDLSIKSIGFCLISAGIFRGPQALDTVLQIGCEAIRDGVYDGCEELYMIGYTSKEMDGLLHVAPKVLGEPVKMYDEKKRSQVSGLSFDTVKGFTGKLFSRFKKK